jgi:hypothetical protein
MMAKTLFFPRAEFSDPYFIGVVDAPMQDRYYQIVVEGQRLLAWRCASCLLQPMPGDTVIILNVSRQFYLTHIVMQRQPEAQMLDMAKLTLATNSFHVHADAMTQDIGHLSVKADVAYEVATTAKILETPVLIQKADRYHINAQNFTLNS